MKKLIITTCILFLCSLVLFSQNYDKSRYSIQETESYVFSQIKHYSNAHAWLIVIENTNNLLEKYPFSSYKTEAFFYQAESYYHLDLLTDAQPLFENILLNKQLEITMKRKSQYYLALILTRKGEHEKALPYLYELVENPFYDETLDKDVLLYSARSLSALRRNTELTAVLTYYINQFGEGTIPLEVEPLLGNLWLGMGIEAFTDTRYEEAMEYFRRADLQKVEGEKNPLHYEYSGLFQAIIYYIEEDIEAALNLLETRINYDGYIPFEYASLLALLYGEKANNIKCEQFAKVALEMFEQNTQMNNKTRLYLLQMAIYYHAHILYERQDYSGVSLLLDTLIAHLGDHSSHAIDSNILLLHAQSLYKAGYTEKAIQIFIETFPQSPETAKALFLSGEWEEGANIGLQVEDPYLQGLSYYIYRDWEKASQSFIEDYSNAKSDNSWAQYYAGMSLYYAGNYEESLATLSSFYVDYTYHIKIWDAYLVGAICALQTGQTDKALEYSLSAIQASKTSSQRQTSIMFAASLYVDDKEYALANRLLQEYSNSTEVASISSRLLLAQTYADMGRLQAADSELEKIISRFPYENLTREAAFKRGELYFFAEDYLEAESLFRDFRFRYTSGTYTDSALYYEAESRRYQNDVQGSILLHTDLTNRYKNSSYRFSSINQLVLLHRNLREYDVALDYAHLAKTEYPIDFTSSNLENHIQELSVLIEGVDEDIAHKIFDWQNAGENETPSGRILGYELALLYVQNEDNGLQALDILNDISSKLLSNFSEYELYANVLDLLGKIERGRGQCEQAARHYLQKVEVLTSFSAESELMSKSLYSAIEAFDCAGKSADAYAVYEQMGKVYNDSVWYNRASILLNITE